MSPELDLFIVVVVGVLLNVLMHRIARNHYPEAKLVIPDAYFYGQESKGMTGTKSIRQMSGNGILALTDKEICFWQSLPRREFRFRCQAYKQLKFHLPF